MSSVMADGGAAIGSVLRNWPHVFSILNLFRESGVSIHRDPDTDDSFSAATQTSATTSTQDDGESETKVQSIPPLVRIPYTQNGQQAEEQQ